MSERYQAGFITKTTTTPTGPYQSGAAPGVWTLDQQLQYQQQGVWPTAGLLPNYIEDVFSTYLYDGDSTTRTIVNGIDLSTKGGLVWTKKRNLGASHNLVDTARGGSFQLQSNTTAAQSSTGSPAFAFTTSGYTVNGATGYNGAGSTYVSWTFRKQAKFFDVVTYTGNGTAGRTVSHSLGSVPGCIIVKQTDGTTSDWVIYHRSLGATKAMFFDTSTGFTSAGYWNDTAPTSTQFSLGVSSSVNANGRTYVAYLFAHDAGGFGASGSDNVITCGTFTADASGYVNVNLGYEPQFVLTKCTSTTDNWTIYDDMRGMPASTTTTNTGNTTARLKPNVSNAEDTGTTQIVNVTSTGFAYHAGGYGSQTFIYIAIRRGPMRTPTSGTSVFKALSKEGNSSPLSSSPVGVVDLAIVRAPQWDIDTQTYTTGANLFCDRLRGLNSSGYALALDSTTTSAEASASSSDVNPITSYARQAGLQLIVTNSLITNAYWLFRRAPGFFDEVCYTGTGSLRTVSHNLAAVPELLIVKRRDTVEDWNVYSATTGNAAYLRLNTTAAVGTAGADALWGSTTPTSSVFTVKTSNGTNANTGTYVSYLFASCPGVSKVGSYTGSGTTKQIDCGFTGGARFVLIKRTDSTGDWYVWDSTRGIVAGNDPYILLNSTAVEVTNTDYVDTYSAGFEISSTAPAAINANGGTFIFLAIA